MARRSSGTVAPERVLGEAAIWTAVRALSGGGAQFTLDAVMAHMAAARKPRLSADRRTARGYLQRLILAGVIQAGDDGYSLPHDPGPKTPRVRKDGTCVAMGAGRRAIWRTMRMLGQFTSDDVVKLGSTEEVQLGIIDVRKYIFYLAKAGYLVEVFRPEERTRPVTWRLVPSKSTGPMPPQIRRYHEVYDPNTRMVVWTDEGEAL